MRLFLGFLVLCLGLMLGCGGGGGSSANSDVRTFITDNLNVGYDHVWVTIQKVELTNASGNTTIFDETASGGTTVDLRTLRDSSGERFSLLSAATIPSGTYTGIIVTASKDLSLVATGSTSSISAVFADSGDSTKSLSITLPDRFDTLTNKNLVIDFNLEDWVYADGVVTSASGFVRKGVGDGLGDHSRHDPSVFEGTVSGLTGDSPNFTFTLGHGPWSMTVQTSTDTSIYNNDGSANPTLVDGAKVFVQGTYDTTLSVLTAKTIRIMVATEDSSSKHIEGIVTSLDSIAGTMTVHPKLCDFRPSGSTVSVLTTDSSSYYDSTGAPVTKDVFFDALTADTSKVVLEGTLSGGVFTAKRLLVLPSLGAGITVRFKGSVSVLDSTAKTFDLTVGEWGGAFGHEGIVIHVVATDTLPDGLANGNHVSSKGTFDYSTKTLSASSIKIVD